MHVLLVVGKNDARRRPYRLRRREDPADGTNIINSPNEFPAISKSIIAKHVPEN